MAQIVILHGEEYTEKDIAAKLHYSKTVVQNAIVKSNADDMFQHRKMSGHSWKNYVQVRPLNRTDINVSKELLQDNLCQFYTLF